MAVVMLLLRPFFVYQLTENPNFARDPVAVNSLLQRLIKKKDDHHSAGIGEFLAVQCAERKIAPPLPNYAEINNFTAFSGTLAAVVKSWQPNTVFQVCPLPKYYRLLSKFQI